MVESDIALVQWFDSQVRIVYFGKVFYCLYNYIWKVKCVFCVLNVFTIILGN